MLISEHKILKWSLGKPTQEKKSVAMYRGMESRIQGSLNLYHIIFTAPQFLGNSLGKKAILALQLYHLCKLCSISTQLSGTTLLQRPRYDYGEESYKA